ncbi:MAG: hypothetical protein Ct9H300mP11_25750 [Chloroflexota bacterium]|nr:MAG: hypothetical protein Ct9H300mP11_25750 [Chloroflexota bacterium]
MLSAVALSAYWRWAIGRAKNRYIYIFAAGALTVLLLSPMYAERRTYLAENAAKIEQSQEALEAERHEWNDLLRTLNELPPGRIFAGAAGGGHWGDLYRVGSTQVYHLLSAEGLDVMSYSLHTYSLPLMCYSNLMKRAGIITSFNVRYVVAPNYWESPPFARLLQKFGRHNLYRVETTGYFVLVGSDLALTGKATDLYKVAYGWLSSTLPERSVTLECILPILPLNQT